eukprot:2354701-Amphidinium_carterae.2
MERANLCSCPPLHRTSLTRTRKSAQEPIPARLAARLRMAPHVLASGALEPAPRRDWHRWPNPQAPLPPTAHAHTHICQVWGNEPIFAIAMQELTQSL